jgi:iron-sulfur cluster insertion protein
MITLTETAKNYLTEQLSKQTHRYVKLSVKGGGCAGFSYDYSFSDEKDPMDFEIKLNEVNSFLVDGMSFMYVAGTQLDYVSDLAGSSLKLSNPNETSSCGCGKSFAV